LTTTERITSSIAFEKLEEEMRNQNEINHEHRILQQMKLFMNNSLNTIALDLLEKDKNRN
jgi:hypothetical protein